MGRRVTNRSGGGSGTGEEEVAAHILDENDAHDASAISLETLGFGGNLDSTITTVQEFAQLFNDIDFGGIVDPPVGDGHTIVYLDQTLTQRGTLRFAAPFVVSDDNVEEETIVDFDVDSLGLEVVETTDIGVTVPPLVDGLIPGEFIPTIAINDVFGVASEAEMLALDAAVGDVALRTDIDPADAYMLSSLPASTIGNWTLINLGSAVLSVNAENGIVVLLGEHIDIDASAFSGNLDVTVTNVQLLADALDALTVATGSPSGSAGGELAGTYPNPTIATVHSGTSHADVQAAAEATAANDLSEHVDTTVDAHLAEAINLDDAGFVGLLVGITTAQTFADTVDTIDGTSIPLDTSAFVLNLGPAVTNVQALAEAFDQYVSVATVTSVNSYVGAVELTASDVEAISILSLGTPDGPASLDSEGRLALAQWPDGLVINVNGHDGSEVTLVAADIAIDAADFSTNLDGSVTDLQLLGEAVDALVTASAPVRQTFSNANVTVNPGATLIAQTGTMSAARTATLPAASSMVAGSRLTVIDESGTVSSTNRINVARAGSDQINGLTTSYPIVTSYGSATLISDGVSNWSLIPSADAAFQTAIVAAFAGVEAITYFGTTGLPLNTQITPFIRTVLDDANAAAVATTLGLRTAEEGSYITIDESVAGQATIGVDLSDPEAFADDLGLRALVEGSYIELDSTTPGQTLVSVDLTEAEDFLDDLGVRALQAGSYIDIDTGTPGQAIINVDLSEGKTGNQTWAGGTANGDTLTILANAGTGAAQLTIGNAATTELELNSIALDINASGAVTLDTGSTIAITGLIASLTASLGVGLTGPLTHTGPTAGTGSNSVAMRQDVYPTAGVAMTAITAGGTVATTGSTVTSVLVISNANLPNDSAIYVQAIVVAHRTGGASGAAGDSAAYRIEAVYKDIAGTLTLITSTTTTIGESVAGWDCTCDASSNAPRVRVTGAATTDITWHCEARYRYVTT